MKQVHQHLGCPLHWSGELIMNMLLMKCASPRVGKRLLTVGWLSTHSWPWPACSPDGIVYREANPLGAIEIKCPFSNKEMTIEECCKDSSFYLKKNPDGVITLKQSHVYYYQCQGALNITGLDWIDVVVYMRKDFFV